MPDPSTPGITVAYLAQLEESLRPLSAETRREIVAGVREELQGLNDGDARQRIAELGDPEFIAATALAETESDRGAGDPTSARVPLAVTEASPAAATPREPGWYPVVAAVTFMFGSFVVPVFGTIVGLGAVWFSKTWTRTEKLIATLAPVAVLVVGGLVSLVSGVGLGGLNGWHLAVILAICSPLAIGAWLLWRAKRRWTPAKA